MGLSKTNYIYSNKVSLFRSHKSTYNKKYSIGIIIDWAGTNECIIRKRTVEEWLYNNGRERKPDYIIYLGMQLVFLPSPDTLYDYSIFNMHYTILDNITNKWNNTKYNINNNNCLTFCLDYIENLRKKLKVSTFNIRWSLTLLEWIHSKIKSPPCKCVVNVDTDNARVIYCKSNAKPIQETSFGAASMVDE